MREIRMTGSTENELKRGIDFILDNQEYKEEIKEITHIIVNSNSLVGFSHPPHFIEKYPDLKGQLPIPVDKEGFSSMVSLWWSKQEEPNYDSYADSSKKGFLLSAGKDWGELDAANGFGFSDHTRSSQEEDSIVKMEHLSAITVIVNQEVWGK